jgi:hypothetical protein
MGPARARHLVREVSCCQRKVTSLIWKYLVGPSLLEHSRTRSDGSQRGTSIVAYLGGERRTKPIPSRTTDGAPLLLERKSANPVGNRDDAFVGARGLAAQSVISAGSVLEREEAVCANGATQDLSVLRAAAIQDPHMLSHLPSVRLSDRSTGPSGSTGPRSGGCSRAPIRVSAQHSQRLIQYWSVGGYRDGRLER